MLNTFNTLGWGELWNISFEFLIFSQIYLLQTTVFLTLKDGIPYYKPRYLFTTNHGVSYFKGRYYLL